MPWALANEASVSSTKRIVDRSSGRKLRPWSFVRFSNLVVRFKALNSSSVVGWLPGALSCTGAHTSGRTLTPIYWANSRWLIELGCVSAIYNVSILSDCVIEQVFTLGCLMPVMFIPLNNVGFYVLGVRGLLQNRLEAISSSSKMECVPKQRESST